MAQTLPPLTPANAPVSNNDGKPSQSFATWLSAAANLLNSFPAVSTILTTLGGLTLTGGFSEKPFSLGTLSSGSVTPTPLSNLKQTLVNGGNFTINAPTVVGDIELYVTNNASAGTITFSGFTKQFTGDLLDTTNTHEFKVIIYCDKNDAGAVRTSYIIKAMQ